MNEHLVSDSPEILLQMLEVAKQETLSPAVLRDPEWYRHVEVAGRGIVLGLRGYILSEEAGKQVEARAYYWQKTKPWWLPRFLWRRVPEQREITVQVATPLWTYPQATVAVPALGPAVMKVRRW